MGRDDRGGVDPLPARVKMFDRIELRSRILGWDDRFTYAEQASGAAGTAPRMRCSAWR
jgi:hypothetical protein